MKAVHHIAVCICTYKRPLMLGACLQSLSEQIIAKDMIVEVIVVDNDEYGSASETVHNAITNSRLPIRYTMQRKRGIAAARNHAIDHAIEIGADWIAFIDDDETAERDWLTNLMALEYRDTPVLQGRCENTYPDKMPFWAVARRFHQNDADEGTQMFAAITNNVRFSTAIVRAGLRFDEALGMGGGEDIDFFRRAHDAGFSIKRTNMAITNETVHPERLTYRGQVYRAYWSTASTVRVDVQAHGSIRTWRRETKRILENAVGGALTILSAPLFLALGIDEFKRRAVDGGRLIGKSAGRLSGLCGIIPQAYATVVGK